MRAAVLVNSNMGTVLVDMSLNLLEPVCRKMAILISLLQHQRTLPVGASRRKAIVKHIIRHIGKDGFPGINNIVEKDFVPKVEVVGKTY
jgi:hypothetical protein